jgi:hypothetical protein
VETPPAVIVPPGTTAVETTLPTFPARRVVATVFAPTGPPTATSASSAHGHLGIPENCQGIQSIKRVRNDRRLLQVTADVEGLAGQQGRQKLPRLNHADHVVGCALAHWKAGVRRFDQQLADRRFVVLGVDPVHVRPGRHEAAHGPVAEAQHARDHAALLLLDHARALGLADEHLDLFFGDGRGIVGLGAEEAEDQGGGGIQQPDRRGCDLRDDQHQRGHGAGDPLRVAQGQLLGHEFTDHD